MKIIYSILILIFTIVAVFCLRGFFSVDPVQSPAEKKSQQQAVTNKAQQKKVAPAENPEINGHGIAELLDNNIFEIDRGISQEQRQNAGGGVSTPGKDLFTLTGVYKFCGVKGAIIIKKGPSNAGFSRNPARRNPSVKEKENNIKNFYQLGEEVGYGYTFAAIDDKSITLKKDGEEVVLKINEEKEKTEQASPPQIMPPMPSMRRMEDMRPPRT